MPKSTYVSLDHKRKQKFFYFGCSLVRRFYCKINKNNNGTDGQTDRQRDRVRRNMRPPPREEGRITNYSHWHVFSLAGEHNFNAIFLDYVRPLVVFNPIVWSPDTVKDIVDPSAAEFRRRRGRQPAPCRVAAAGRNWARRHANRNLLKPPPPQFLRRAAAQVILTNCDTCSSFIMKLSNSLFGR